MTCGIASRQRCKSEEFKCESATDHMRRNNSHKRRKRILGLVVCVVVLSVTGCSIVRQPSPEEYESVRQNKKVIALFRLTGSLDSQEVHLLAHATVGPNLFNQINLLFSLANMDTGEPVSKFPVGSAVAPWIRSYGYFSPSPASTEDGWGVFLLEPGTYYLSITSGFKGVVEPIQEFRFVVPPNVPLVYIGSLHVACTTIEKAGYYGARGFVFGSCLSDVPAANEEDAAKRIAQASFKEFGPPLSAIMQSYKFTPLAPGSLSQLAPVGLFVPNGKIDVESPEWVKRAVGMGLLPSQVLFALLSGGGGGGGGPGAGAVVALALAWAPVGTVLGYLGGKWSESSWEPCRQALQESITKFDPMAALATKLKTALEHEEVQTIDIGIRTNAEGEALPRDVKSILNAQITRMVLRFCSPTLCLDVATHATAFDVATQTYVYDNVFVYSGGQLELQPYELLVEKPESVTAPSGRDLEAYCGEGGAEKFQGDVSEALDATVYRIVQELGLRPE